MSQAALPTLRAPRLTLRPLNLDDADAIVEGVGNFDVSKWLSVVPYPYSRDDALWFINDTLDRGLMNWAICDETGLVGVVGLENELGYWLARPAWRKGYGFEAAHAAVKLWFSDPKRGELGSGYFQQNEKSGAVLRCLGFEEVGKRKIRAKALSQEIESNVMCLTRENWQTRQTFDIRTRRLRLRPTIESDATALSAMTVKKVVRNMSTLSEGMSVDEVAEFLRAGQFCGLPGFRLAIEKDGQYIGSAGFGGTPGTIGYLLHPDHWGQGLMSEALGAFLPELFKRFPINRIEADHFVDNPVSGTILRKFGFEVTGRDMGRSKGRVEPAPVITYALRRENLKV